MKAFEITYRGKTEFCPPHHVIVIAVDEHAAKMCIVHRLNMMMDAIDWIGCIELIGGDIVFIC